jgi:hypothetical protein
LKVISAKQEPNAHLSRKLVAISLTNATFLHQSSVLQSQLLKGEPVSHIAHITGRKIHELQRFCLEATTVSLKYDSQNSSRGGPVIPWLKLASMTGHEVIYSTHRAPSGIQRNEPKWKDSESEGDLNIARLAW